MVEKIECSFTKKQLRVLQRLYQSFTEGNIIYIRVSKKELKIIEELAKIRVIIRNETDYQITEKDQVLITVWGVFRFPSKINVKVQKNTDIFDDVVNYINRNYIKE